jgi:nicotinamidase-related amidase
MKGWVFGPGFGLPSSGATGDARPMTARLDPTCGPGTKCQILTTSKGIVGWPHHPFVHPRSGEAVIEKWHSSAFHNTDFDARLTEVGIGALVSGRKDYCTSQPHSRRRSCRVALRK